MFEITRKTIEWAGRPLTLETGRIARQADGAVLVTYGETVVLCTAVSAKTPKVGIDFFPLTVNYQEKTFAAGKIPGGFFKREGRASEKETLTSRLIDRPIRPLFPEGFFNETQVVCTVLSYDKVNDSDVVALIGASAALTLAGVPFMGPVAGARVGYINGEYVLNPSIQELEDSVLDLVVAGTGDSVLMVESEAKELSEEIMLGAVTFGHEAIKPVIKLIVDIAQIAAKDAWEMPAPPEETELKAKVKQLAEAKLRQAYQITAKQERVAAIDAAKKEAKAGAVPEGAENAVEIEGKVKRLLKKLEQDIVRTQLLDTGRRIDGREVANVRPILAEACILPKTHGSALFTRGETQALVAVTLGTSEDEQIIDNLDGDSRDHFMLHYNFPPYSVGEATPMRAPGRREIGHGKLAKRALMAVMPSKEAFPYTIRIVSEITESNGSSSMASVCGAALAMMDAGVPITKPVAGIAMGLIKEGAKFTVLSDIMGDEDHLGDMDFKVAGTETGVTALQMDIKINGVTTEIMKVALSQAKTGRLHILGEMAKALTGPRGELSANAPQIIAITIPKEKIREIIGPGGSMIREICEKSGAKIDIEDDGTVRVAAVNAEERDIALQMIQDIAAVPEVGRVYQGTVTKIVDFGAFVKYVGSNEGLVHISEFANERVESVSQFVNEGDSVHVKLIGVDQRGKVRLSYKAVNQETGEDLEPGKVYEERERSSSGDRDRDRGPRKRRA